MPAPWISAVRKRQVRHGKGLLRFNGSQDDETYQENKNIIARSCMIRPLNMCNLARNLVGQIGFYGMPDTVLRIGHLNLDPVSVDFRK